MYILYSILSAMIQDVTIHILEKDYVDILILILEILFSYVFYKSHDIRVSRNKKMDTDPYG